MGKTEVKTEINKVLENIPEEVLKQILDVLKQFQPNQSMDIFMLDNLNKVINENDNLLKRLAQ